MEKQIGIIGSGASKESILKVLEDKGIKDVIVVESGESLPEFIPPPSFKIKARPEPIIPEMIEYRDYRDGKTLRRERRKRQRKTR